MTAEQIIEARKQFELGLVFHVGKMFPDKETGGCIVMNDDGRYVMDHIQHCWQGYLMGYKHTLGMLERYKPDRFVGNAMVHELCAAMEMADVDTEWAQDVFKNVLKLAGNFPK